MTTLERTARIWELAEELLREGMVAQPVPIRDATGEVRAYLMRADGSSSPWDTPDWVSELERRTEEEQNWMESENALKEIERS